MSLAPPGSCAPKSLDGTPITTNPRSLNFDQTSSSPAYCGVKPQRGGIHHQQRLARIVGKADVAALQP
jgi:hypothetical protein